MARRIIIETRSGDTDADDDDDDEESDDRIDDIEPVNPWVEDMQVVIPSSCLVDKEGLYCSQKEL